MLELNIVDQAKRKQLRKRKQIILGTITTIFILLFYLPNVGVFSFEVSYIRFYLLLITSIAGAFSLGYVFQVPTKGKVHLTNESITVLMGRQSRKFLLTENTRITFFQFPDNEEGTSYYIEVRDGGRKILYELDIVFVSEKAPLEKMKKNWKQSGIQVETKKTIPATISS
jgi:hypothetical protein